MKRVVRWLVVLLLLGGAVWFDLKKSPPPAAPVDLTKHDGQTIDFSSGRPVVKDSAADQAAMAAAKKEMDEAVKGVTFGPTTKPPAPATPPKKN